jgi:hypothetical protein
VAPLIVVNGPIARRLEINGGYNCFGQGFRANVTIGRAVRLVLMNVGGGLPGSGDRATQGSPRRSPTAWRRTRPRARGSRCTSRPAFPRDTSVVTVFGCEGPHNIQDHYSNTGLGVLRTVAGAMGQAGSNNLLGWGWPLLVLGPEHAATIARDGYSKAKVKEFLFEHARFPLARLGREYQAQQIERHGAVDAPGTMLSIVKRAEDIAIIVAGGAGKHSCWQPTFGDGTHFTRRVIEG